MATSCPTQRKAHNKVKTAIANGTLRRLPCQVCGNPKSQAHHEDYARALDVKFFCKKHHVEADHQRRRVELEQKYLSRCNPIKRQITTSLVNSPKSWVVDGCSCQARIRSALGKSRLPEGKDYVDQIIETLEATRKQRDQLLEALNRRGLHPDLFKA